MHLRRPRLSDKEAVLEMIAEFEKHNSAMDGGFYKSSLDYEDWLESLVYAEMGLNIQKDLCLTSNLSLLMRTIKHWAF